MISVQYVEFGHGNTEADFLLCVFTASLRTNFTGLPVLVSNSKAKRGLGTVTYSPDPINFATDLVLNETTLFEVADFSASVDSGSLDISVTIGGFLTYNIITSTLGTCTEIAVLR